MLGKLDLVFFLRGVDNAFGALLERCFKLKSISFMSSFHKVSGAHQWYDIRRLGCKPM